MAFDEHPGGSAATSAWRPGLLIHQVSQRYDRSYGLAVCDIDQLKRYNHASGHLAGDDALRSVWAAIAGAIRAVDRVLSVGVAATACRPVPQTC